MSTSGIVGILPSSVAVVESFGDRTDAVVFPQEEPAIARAVEQRRREFSTTRHCARLALERLGQAPVAIPVGQRRQPIWPDGFVGSLTHCVGYRAAAVTRSTELGSLGIDAEPNEPLPREVLAPISHASERAMLAGLPDRGVRWDRLLFSAKEAVYKAWSPLTEAWLGFHDVELSIDPDRNAFDVRFLVPLPASADGQLDRLRGSWIRHGDLVMTAAVTMPTGTPPAKTPAGTPTGTRS